MSAQYIHNATIAMLLFSTNSAAAKGKGGGGRGGGKTNDWNLFFIVIVQSPCTQHMRRRHLQYHVLLLLSGMCIAHLI